MNTISGQSIYLSGLLKDIQSFTGDAIASFLVDFTGANQTYLVDTRLYEQQRLFSTPETLFFDNTANPNPVTVSISITNAIFAVPAYSAGFFHLAVGPGSQITLTSVGGAASVAHAQLFNYSIPPVVWQALPGGSGQSITAADGAIQTMGTKGDGAVLNPATPASEISLLKGILTRANTLVMPNIIFTQTLVNLPAATSTLLIAANVNRRALRWMNTGANPFTASPGLAAAVAGNGMNYNGAPSAGMQGGSDAFTQDASQQAFTAISTAGTTVTVWEGI